MDADRLGRDAATSLRLPFTAERRLIGGAVLAPVAYAAWVAATGAVLVSAAAVSSRSLTVDPWTTTATLAAAVAAVLWVFGPAAAWTYFVVDQLTNPAGNLEHHYRVQYPSTVVVPAAALFAGVGAAGAVSGFPAPVLAALVASGTFALVRTLAYSYRVFTLSVPRALQAFVFESGCVLAVAILAALARVSGRPGLLSDAARGVDSAVGTAVTVPLVTGSREVAAQTLPALPALAAAYPVALAVTYLAVQTLGGLVARGRGVTVPRSRLRTGQRYPAFARPAAGRSGRRGSPGDASAGGLDGASAAELLEGENGPGPGGRVTDTRVFTPPDDADPASAVPAEVAAETETQIADQEADPAEGDGSGGNDGTEATYECPACEETFSGETAFAYCPTCGTELEPR